MYKGILLGREDWSFNPVKLCVGFGWFFVDNFGLMCSFGLALFVVQGMVHLYMWELVRFPGKSMGQILNETKVIEHVIK